ncbi:unnamed protein product [Albugo candida]|uniref:Uncharacterized protein n=1 Tax=Albugo candida TaxID=65357 RepID=A0A024GJ69_9STRA|nr:unnamed protein product [Albugo candida]|eukprot:CCI46820.1 unnamed protein product [Albugo candida]
MGQIEAIDTADKSPALLNTKKPGRCSLGSGSGKKMLFATKQDRCICAISHCSERQRSVQPVSMTVSVPFFFSEFILEEYTLKYDLHHLNATCCSTLGIYGLNSISLSISSSPSLYIFVPTLYPAACCFHPA